jgi:DNA-binding CsgD family transcriptional regulator
MRAGGPDVPEPVLLGRDAERGRLRGVVDRAHDGTGGSLLLRGPAGIGKSALVQESVRDASARGARVLGAAGFPADGEIGYGSLHELLHPVLEQAAEALPPRQMLALEVALGLADGAVPEPLVVGTAVLGLLQRLAEQEPVVVVVDDLHWCDPSSIDVISFVAGRAAGARLAVLGTSRDDPAYAHVGVGFRDELAVGPLDAPSADVLVDRFLVGGRSGARDRVLAQAEGNPLALVELSAWTGRPHGDADRERMAVPERIEHAFLAEARQLPPDARRALLLLASGAGDSRDEVLAAADVLGIDADAFDEAERVGLLLPSEEEEQRFRFRHPLVGSALLGSARASGVRAEHEALARIVQDPARRAWHLAAAAPGWDEEVARALDLVAGAAARRGARQEAAAAAERAAELTPDRAARGRRLAFAADQARQLGRTGETLRLLEQARRLEVDPATAKDLAAVEWLLALSAGTPTRGVPGFLRLADAVSGADRTEVLLWAASICYISPQPDDVRVLVRDELERVPGGAIREIALALVGVVRAGSRIADLAAALDAREPSGAVVLECLAFVAEDQGDLDGALRCWDVAVAALAGRPADEAIALLGRGTDRVIADDLDGALDDHRQSARLAAELGLPLVAAQCSAAMACVHATRGDVEAARTLLATVPELALPARTQAIVAWAEARVAEAEHRYADAADALVRTGVNPPIALWAQAGLADVAARAGRGDAATRAWLDRARGHDLAIPGSRLRLRVLHTEALLGEDPDGRLRTAIEVGGAAEDVVGTARVRLALGERLRRERRVGEAREQLAEALAALRSAGLRPLAERAAGELRAAGGSAGPEPVRRDASGLTGQELQVGRLAASGFSNREIADRLYLSSATVSTHLRSTFQKLGVSRRTQLSALLGAARPSSADAS